MKFSEWRTVDLIVASVLGVASGVIFVAWNAAYAPLSVALAGFTPGLVGSLGGVWLIGGLLVAQVVRRPGAAILGEVIAASVSAIIGNQWGFTVLVLGIAQGLAMELGFRLMDRARPDFAIVAVAASEAAIAWTLDYVQQRKAFGQTLGSFQNTRHTLAELQTQVQVARVFVDRCTELMMRNQLDTATASMAKYWTTDLQCRVMDECVQLFGGYGFMWEYPITRAYADARVQRIYGGTNEIMKEVVARSMGLAGR
jgi:alkylation response protein AidB-like acyl-CoA dehydrogenase